MFLQDQCMTTCPMEDCCQAIFYPGVREAMLTPHVSRLFTDFSCLEMLQATERDPGRVPREMACNNLPCGRSWFCIWNLEAILLYVICYSLD